MLTRYVNTASTAGGDGTTNDTAGSTRAFASLKEAIDSLPSTLSDAYTIYCSGSAADTTDLDSAEWDFTTSATNYVLVTTTGAQRHSGVYDTGIYRLECTNTNILYLNAPANHIRFDGLQLKVTVTDASSYIGIKTSNANVTTSGADYRVSNCIVKAVRTSGDVIGFNARPYGSGGSGKSGFWNCIAIDCTSGYSADHTGPKFYNCGAYDCTYGFVADAAFIVKNCLSKSNGGSIGFVGTFSGSSNYNAEDDGNGAPGANSYSATTFTFVNAASDNFHLASNDAGAKDRGTDLSGDADFPFSTDIDGQTRSGTWDIGPDEYISGVPKQGHYYQQMLRRR